MQKRTKLQCTYTFHIRSLESSSRVGECKRRSHVMHFGSVIAGTCTPNILCCPRKSRKQLELSNAPHQHRDGEHVRDHRGYEEVVDGCTGLKIATNRCSKQRSTPGNGVCVCLCVCVWGGGGRGVAGNSDRSERSFLARLLKQESRHLQARSFRHLRNASLIHALRAHVPQHGNTTTHHIVRGLRHRSTKLSSRHC